MNRDLVSSIFEALMLLSFGAAWPASIYRSWTSRTTRGKSLQFMYIVLFGYCAGIIHNLIATPNYVLFFYLLDVAMVTIDLCLYYRNRRIEKQADALVAAGVSPDEAEREIREAEKSKRVK